MPLDTRKIKPLKGKISCALWENSFIGLPLSLYYSIEIPVEPFDTGHDYVDQPSDTSFVIEWIKFSGEKGEQEKNWKNLTGRKFSLSYGDSNAEGSIYLGSEHCQFNSIVKFNKLNGVVFDVDLNMSIDFNIDTINLPNDAILRIATTVEFEGFNLYPPEMLPSFLTQGEPMHLIQEFIDPTVYDSNLKPVAIGQTQWQRLSPKI